MRILLLLSLVFSTSSFAKSYVYKVEKGDNLSTILNSFGIYESTADLYKSVKRHKKANKLKSEHLIYPMKNLNLTIGPGEKLFKCNLKKKWRDFKI